MRLLEFIEAVNRASGTVAKSHLVQTQLPPFGEHAFHYALNPYNNYNIKQVNMVGKGDNDLNADTFDLLDRMAAGNLSGNAAREALQNHARTLAPDAVTVLQMILDGKFRVGLGITTLNRVLKNKIPVHQPMLASKMDLSRLVYPVWASPKLDGMRCQSGIKQHFVSRTGKPIFGVNHLAEALSGFHPYDGELMIPGLPFEVSLGQLRSHAECPNAVFYVFDAICTKRPFEERLEIVSNLKNYHPNIKVVKHLLVHNEEELMKFYNQCISAGLEGLVVKTRGHRYELRRSPHWMRCGGR